MQVVDYAAVLMMAALAGVVILVFWAGAVFLGPREERPHKRDPFECGHPSRGAPRRRFSVKFYGVAILFILFDIEAVFLYPWAVVYDELRLFAMAEMFLFLGLLFLALIWVWGKGGLEWD